MTDSNSQGPTKTASPQPDQHPLPSAFPAGSPPPTQQSAPQLPQPITTSNNGPQSSPEPSMSTRPHDARTIHMVLASLGVTAYQERVPLQLLDLAYRYTASILSDAQHLAAEGYVSSATGGSGANKASGTAGGGEQISLAALRLATSSRLGHQFSSGLPKQTMLDLAKDRNKIQLPPPGEKVVFGLDLPHERFVQTGTNWTMLEEWDSEGTMDGEDDDATAFGEAGAVTTGNGDAVDTEDKDEDMEDGFEDVFGEADEDKVMEES